MMMIPIINVRVSLVIGDVVWYGMCMNKEKVALLPATNTVCKL